MSIVPVYLPGAWGKQGLVGWGGGCLGELRACVLLRGMGYKGWEEGWAQTRSYLCLVPALLWHLLWCESGPACGLCVIGVMGEVVSSHHNVYDVPKFVLDSFHAFLHLLLIMTL